MVLTVILFTSCDYFKDGRKQQERARVNATQIYYESAFSGKILSVYGSPAQGFFSIDVEGNPDNSFPGDDFAIPYFVPRSVPGNKLIISIQESFKNSVQVGDFVVKRQNDMMMQIDTLRIVPSWVSE